MVLSPTGAWLCTLKLRGSEPYRYALVREHAWPQPLLPITGISCASRFPPLYFGLSVVIQATVLSAEPPLHSKHPLTPRLTPSHPIARPIAPRPVPSRPPARAVSRARSHVLPGDGRGGGGVRRVPAGLSAAERRAVAGRPWRCTSPPFATRRASWSGATR